MDAARQGAAVAGSARHERTLAAGACMPFWP